METKDQKIEDVLTRGVIEILPSKEGLVKLMKQKKISLYLGIDPTSPDLHLGHTIPLRKLKQFQELGHNVILLIGTFTAQIGDPSERDKKRKPLTLNQIKKNMVSYKKQASKILDFSKIKIKYNTDWLSKLSFGDLVKLTSYFTASRLLERDMFQRRLHDGKEVWVNELLYPLMQGYDSVAMNVDLEIGSTDQTFNMLVGRKLQKIYNKKEKFILTTPMLLGLDDRKMSKTSGNTVNLSDKPEDIYGKIMSMKDGLIGDYFELCTQISLKEIREIRKDLKQKKVNPRDLKARLAKEIVKLYYGKRAGDMAEKEFNEVFKEKKLPSKIPVFKTAKKVMPILDLLFVAGLVSSRSQGKRLILQNGVKIDKKTKTDLREIVKIKDGMILQVGKRKFVRIKRFVRKGEA